MIKLCVAVLTGSGTLLHVFLNSILFMHLELGGRNGYNSLTHHLFS